MERTEKNELYIENKQPGLPLTSEEIEWICHAFGDLGKRYDIYIDKNCGPMNC